MTGEELVKRAREPMTTPIDELAGIDPVRDRIFETLMTGGVWDRHLRGGHSIDASKHAAALADLLAATLDAARSTPVPASNDKCALCGHTRTAHLMGVACCDCSGFVPASNVSEGLREALTPLRGFPVGDGSDRHWQPDPNGAYIGFEDAIDALRAALAHAAPEGLDALDRADNLARFAGRYLAGDSDIQPEDVRAAIDDYWLHRRLSQPDATEEAGPTLTLADQHPGLRSGDLHHGLRHDDGDPDA